MSGIVPLPEYLYIKKNEAYNIIIFFNQNFNFDTKIEFSFYSSLQKQMKNYTLSLDYN